MLNFPSEEQAEGVVLEHGVVIETGAIVEAKLVGQGTLIEIYAKVGKGAVIGKVWMNFVCENGNLIY